jgi:hypothetical protein
MHLRKKEFFTESCCLRLSYGRRLSGTSLELVFLAALEPYFVADADFRQRKTKAASNQAFPGFENIGLYQISLFLRGIDKVTAMAGAGTLFCRGCRFSPAKDKSRVKSGFFGPRKYRFVSNFFVSQGYRQSHRNAKTKFCRGYRFSPAKDKSRVKSGFSGLRKYRFVSNFFVSQGYRQSHRNAKTKFCRGYRFSPAKDKSRVKSGFFGPRKYRFVSNFFVSQENRQRHLWPVRAHDHGRHLQPHHDHLIPLPQYDRRPPGHLRAAPALGFVSQKP